MFGILRAWGSNKEKLDPRRAALSFSNKGATGLPLSASL
jgi:hypothetical protein